MKSAESEREDNVFGGQPMAVFVGPSQEDNVFGDQSAAVFVEPSQDDHDFGDADEDVEELVPVENSSDDDVGGLVIFWAWYTYIVSLSLGFTGGYLVPGAFAFMGKFHFGVMTSLAESLVFMIASVLSGILGLSSNLVTDSRRATFSTLQLHLDEHIRLQKQLDSYRTHLLEHLANLHDPEHLARYFQCFALDPVIENAEGKIRIMIGEGQESKRDRIKRRYLDTVQALYLILSMYGIVAAPVSTGGLMCFLTLTANAVLGDYITLPNWAFNSVILLGVGVGAHAFVSAIQNYNRQSASEHDLVKNLAMAELKTQACIELCRKTHQQLNQALVLVRKDHINEHSQYSQSDWEPLEPLSSVEEFKKREGGRASYESAGFFGLGVGGGRAIFPIRPKPPKKSRVEVVEEGEQDAATNGRGFV